MPKYNDQNSWKKSFNLLIKRRENKQGENMEHTEALIPFVQSIRKIIR